MNATGYFIYNQTHIRMLQPVDKLSKNITNYLHWPNYVCKSLF